MKYNVHINGERVDVDALEVVLDKSEELDFGVMVIPSTVRFENYQILHEVIITADDGTNTKTFDPFVIISDKVEPVSRFGYYKHTITFIESIHKFEKILDSNVFIPQPKDGQTNSLLYVLNHIRDVVPFERESIHTSTRLFDINSDLENYLATIDAPQFFFNGKTLREMLNDVSSYVNAIARLGDGKELIFDFYNEILGVAGLDDVIYKRLQNQTKNFSSGIEVKMENGVGADDENRSIVVYPSEGRWANFRSSKLKLTDTDYELRVPFKIETLIKAEAKIYVWSSYFEGATVSNFPASGTINTVYKDLSTGDHYYWASTEYLLIPNFDTTWELEYADPTGGVWKGHIIVDVTSQMYTKGNWDRLDLDKATEAERSSQDLKVNTLYYTIGGNTFKNPELAGIFDTIKPVGAFANRAVEDLAFTFDYNNLMNVNTDMTKAQFRITYVPYVSTRVRAEKRDINDVPYATNTYSNQSDRIVSSERLLNNIYGMAQRTGQDEIEFKKYYNDLTEPFELSSITEDGFIVVKKKYTFFVNYFIVTYELSKNFNRFSNRIALNQENRQYDLPLGDRTTKRNLHYSEYVELSTEVATNNTLFSNRGQRTFMNVISNNSLYDKPIDFVSLYSSEMVDIAETDSIYGKVAKWADANSLNFYWEFDDIIKAGDILITDEYFWGADVSANQFLRYTDANGELNTIQLGFHHDLNDDIPSDLPIITKPTNALIGGHSLLQDEQTDNFVVNKTKSEALSMNYQVHVVPNYQYVDTFVIGKHLLRNNNLIVSKNPQLYIWASDTEYYKATDNTKAVGTMTAIQPSWGMETVTDIILDAQPYVESNLSTLSSKKSWCIADVDGNLYLGVNNDFTELDRVYFNFVNKRENLDYTLVGTPIAQILPPILTQLNTTATSVVANWIDQQTSDKFEYGIRNLTTGGAWTEINETTGTQKTFVGLDTINNEYEVRVRSFFNSLWSTYVTQRTYLPDQIPMVTDLEATTIDDDEIQLTWTDIANETEYELQGAIDGQSYTTSEYALGGSSTYTYSGLNSDTTYKFRIRGINTETQVEGDWSNYDVLATTDALPPTYTIDSYPTGLNETTAPTGTVEVIAPNVPDGTTLYWTINHISTSNADFVSTSGSFTINSNYGSFGIAVNDDNSVEGTEAFTLAIRTGSTSGTIVDETGYIYVFDGVVMTFASGQQVIWEEETQAVFNVDTTNISDGSTGYWRCVYHSNADASDTNPDSGSFTINSNSGTFIINHPDTGDYPDDEFYTLEISDTSGFTKIRDSVIIRITAI